MLTIRKFRETDAVEVSELIKTTERVTNSADYSSEYIEALCAKVTPEWAKTRASCRRPARLP